MHFVENLFDRYKKKLISRNSKISDLFNGKMGTAIMLAKSMSFLSGIFTFENQYEDSTQNQNCVTSL